MSEQTITSEIGLEEEVGDNLGHNMPVNGLGYAVPNCEPASFELAEPMPIVGNSGAAGCFEVDLDAAPGDAEGPVSVDVMVDDSVKPVQEVYECSPEVKLDAVHYEVACLEDALCAVGKKMGKNPTEMPVLIAEAVKLNAQYESAVEILSKLEIAEEAKAFEEQQKLKKTLEEQLALTPGMLEKALKSVGAVGGFLVEYAPITLTVLPAVALLSFAGGLVEGCTSNFEFDISWREESAYQEQGWETNCITDELGKTCMGHKPGVMMGTLKAGVACFSTAGLVTLVVGTAIEAPIRYFAKKKAKEEALATKLKAEAPYEVVGLLGGM